MGTKLICPQMLCNLGHNVPLFPCCYVHKTPVAPEKPPSIGETVFMVGAMGGHLKRKGDGFPGTQALWRGLEKLSVATEMYAIVTQQFYPHPMQSGP